MTCAAYASRACLNEVPTRNTKRRTTVVGASLRQQTALFDGRLLACRETRAKPVADFEQGHISSASCILGNLALMLGRELKWDPVTHSVIGDAEANALLKRPYRAPWVHPTPGAV